MRLPSPAFVVALLALFVALGGTVYAAHRAKINGRAIRVKSLPGNRLKPRSVAANRLTPAALATLRAGSSAPITGAEIDELSLAQVPEAAHAESADEALHATAADTALSADQALEATKVNGHEAGCLPGTQAFAGACWQLTANATALGAPAAAASCAAQGGALPEALQLAAFAVEPGVTLDKGDEWSSDITNMSEVDVFAVVTVSAGSNINFVSSTKAHKFRCVMPLLR
ncbi:MAG: hypothetical protein ACM3N0_12630 [Chloroflexota bacterium]